MPNTTYTARNVLKLAAGHLVAGSGNALSAVAAETKARELDDLLQTAFQSRGESYDGSDIGQHDLKKAILFVRGKKHSKASRKVVIAGAQAALQITAAATGATLGSVVPVLGTLVGGAGGAIAGAGLGVTVTAADQVKRRAKGIYKFLRHTRGAHRNQAAATLMFQATEGEYRNALVAKSALRIILGEEYAAVMESQNTERLADRLKSN
ncbi:hypothetical protein [Roseomonas sp. BN140053]|uniref:hypothetical protein n=1 Tax=Roseomonas sp. BN140053 TaxID=3391898 RepID=UPI0039EAA539